MTYQTYNQKNASAKQHTTGLSAAKNYVEQQLELAGKNKTVLFERHNGLVLFCDRQKKILASMQGRRLQVLFRDSSAPSIMHIQTQLGVPVDKIRAKKALYCRKCRKWLEFHQGLTRCRCGKYLKIRKRFYIHKDQIADSAELAEVQCAVQDIKAAKKIESKKRKKSNILTGITDSIAGRSVIKECKELTRQKSYLAERATLRIHGRIISDEFKIPAMMELGGIFPPPFCNSPQTLNYSKRGDILMQKSRSGQQTSDEDDFSKEEIEIMEKYKAGKLKFKKFTNADDAINWLQS